MKNTSESKKRTPGFFARLPIFSGYERLVENEVFGDSQKSVVKKYYFARKNKKWGVLSSDFETVVALDYDSIKVAGSGDNFNVISAKKDGQEKLFLIGDNDNIDYKEVIQADPSFAESIDAKNFNKELRDFATKSIQREFDGFWRANMSLDEDEACKIAGIVRGRKFQLMQLIEDKHNTYTKMQGKQKPEAMTQE